MKKLFLKILLICSVVIFVAILTPNVIELEISNTYKNDNEQELIFIKYYSTSGALTSSFPCYWTRADGKFGCNITLKEPVSKKGYRFTGWGRGGSGSGASEFGISDGGCTAGRTGNVTLYKDTMFSPCFVPESQDPNITKVTVGYVDLRGEIDTQNMQWIAEDFETCTYNSTTSNSCTLNLPTPQKVSGYTFTGWSEEKGCYHGVMSPKVSYDTLLHACWLPDDLSNSFYIKYNANGGTGAPINQGYPKLDYTSPLFLDNRPIISDKIPIRSGYTFLGWSTNKNATTSTWFPGDKYYANQTMTLYAVWKNNNPTKPSYTITYNANGGTGAPSAQTKTENVNLTISSAVPVRSGYTFLGWSTSKTATTAQYKPGDIYNTNASATLYAVWKKNPNTYTITYNANGGTGAPSAQTKTENVNLIISPVEPFKNGYTFVGWNTNKSATSAQYHSGDIYIRNASMTLYAVWKKAETPITTYTINYDANGGTGAPSKQVSNIGVSVIISNVKPTRNGYIFLGWSTNSASTNVQYSSGTVYSLNASMTLYAVWEKEELPIKNYVITYNANGGKQPPKSQTKEQGIDLTLSDSIPTRKGYEFVGWSTNKNATDVEYEPEDAYSNDLDTTLYAVWSATEYIIIYEMNGGYIDENPNGAVYDDTIKINNPIKKVKIITHENDTGVEVDDEILSELEFDGWTSKDIDKDTAYYANKAWTGEKTKSTNIKFKNLSSDGDSVTLVANWKNNSISLPTIEKDKFICSWNTNQDGSGTSYKSGGKYNISGNKIYSEVYDGVHEIELYAVCEQKENNSITKPKEKKSKNNMIYIIGFIIAVPVAYTGYCYFKKTKED